MHWYQITLSIKIQVLQHFQDDTCINNASTYKHIHIWVKVDTSYARKIINIYILMIYLSRRLLIWTITVNQLLFVSKKTWGGCQEFFGAKNLSTQTSLCHMVVIQHEIYLQKLLIQTSLSQVNHEIMSS